MPLDIKDVTHQTLSSNRCSVPLPSVVEQCPRPTGTLSESRTAEFDSSLVIKHYSKQTGRCIVILIYYRGPGRRMECMTVRGELRQNGRFLELHSLRVSGMRYKCIFTIKLRKGGTVTACRTERYNWPDRTSWIDHRTGRAYVRWGEDGSSRQSPARFTVWVHSAVAGATVGSRNILYRFSRSPSHRIT